MPSLRAYHLSGVSLILDVGYLLLAAVPDLRRGVSPFGCSRVMQPPLQCHAAFDKAYAKAFDCVDHNKLWKILKEMGIPDYLTCLLRNLYTGQETTVRTGHGTTDWFQIGKGVCQGCILSPCLFNLYSEYIMRNVRLDEVKAAVKIAGRNINNLRYEEGTTLMSESEEDLKIFLMELKEESEKNWLKVKHSEN